ncbi:hypothetical protein B0H12DRAFT_1229408, partial [Mycena haematopus]
MSSKPSVLVLGATGFTGKLITEYLAGHKDNAAFTLALGARSKSRLDALAASLDLGTATATVVVNTVGPFYLWGTPVVQACVKHGVHYVDLTGDTLDQAYYNDQNFRDHSGQPVDIDTSTSAYSMRGGMSRHNRNCITTIEKVPAEELRVSQPGIFDQPCVGKPSPRRPLVYRLFLPDTGKTLTGAKYFMAHSDRSVVQRSWGLLEAEAAQDKSYVRYGPAFKYDEFL